MRIYLLIDSNKIFSPVFVDEKQFFSFSFLIDEKKNFNENRYFKDRKKNSHKIFYRNSKKEKKKKLQTNKGFSLGSLYDVFFYLFVQLSVFFLGAFFRVCFLYRICGNAVVESNCTT